MRFFWRAVVDVEQTAHAVHDTSKLVPRRLLPLNVA
jgi:hypothetical protein